ncbi:MAG: ATP synthase F0 subunit B [Kofleriaceae bacterium]
MSTLRKLLTIVALVLSTQVALADEPHNAPPIEDESKKGEPAATVPHEEGHAGHGNGVYFDPSKHFNFLGSPGEHYGKDATGGVYGDGVMTDPATGKPFVDDHGHAVEDPMSAPFIFMVLNFVILLGLLAWKGKPAVEKLAADRHDQIKTAIEEAAKLRTQAADKLAQYEARLKEADAEITALVEGMRVDAEADKKRILEAADRQAVQLKRDAEIRIAAEIESARAALTREVTIAAIAATEKVLRAKVTRDDQQKIVSAFIAGVQDAPTTKAVR